VEFTPSLGKRRRPKSRKRRAACGAECPRARPGTTVPGVRLGGRFAGCPPETPETRCRLQRGSIGPRRDREGSPMWCGSRGDSVVRSRLRSRSSPSGGGPTASQASRSRRLLDAPAEGEKRETGSKPTRSPSGDRVEKPLSGGGTARSSSDGRAGGGTRNLGQVRDGLFGGLRCREPSLGAGSGPGFACTGPVPGLPSLAWVRERTDSFGPRPGTGRYHPRVCAVHFQPAASADGR